MRASMRLAAILAAGALGACQTMSDVASVVTGGPGEPAKPQAEAVKPAAPNEAAPAAPVTGSLMGMSGETLRALWGEPSLKRTETGAEMWQYGGGGATCTLLVYLYPSAANTLAVTHAEAVPGGADEATIAACAKAAGKPPLKPIS